MKKTFSILLMAILILGLSFEATARKRGPAEEEAQVRVPRKEADNGFDLRKIRRAGIGAQAAGSLGLGGLVLDLNITPKWSFITGFGGGQGFQAVSFQAKYVLAGEWLMPYMGMGYAYWMSLGKSGRIEKTNPSILAEKLLNDDERNQGEYRKNLFFPGIGLQFMQLKGEWAGSSVYAELNVLLDVGNFVAAPYGALGFLYYF